MEGNDGEPGGKVSERTLDRYRKLAAGNWGIIVVEALSITEESLARKNQLVINRENLEGYKLLVSEMKRIAPDTLVLFQVTHSGRKSGKAFSNPTALYDAAADEHLLTTGEIAAIRDKLVQAVLLSEEAGADGADFKLCHGYLGSEMLRPANVRDDRWGGSFENRTRFLSESIPEIKDRLKNKAFILGSRISYYEGIRGGCGTRKADELVEELTEMDRIVSLMESFGLDYVNVSAGIPGVTSEITRPTAPSKCFYLHHIRYSKRAKVLASSMKVFGSAYTILQEGSMALAEENLERGYIDFAGWGRQSLADPAFPQKIKDGSVVDYCKMCSGCSTLMVKQEPVNCVIFKNQNQQTR